MSKADLFPAVWIATVIWSMSFAMGNCHAAIPKMINHQGKLTDATGKLLPDGSYDMKYSIYNAATDGDQRWTETWDESTGRVQVTNGLFNVLLGTHNPIAIAFDENYWLEIQVANGGSYETLSPRQQIVSGGYAFRADKADDAVKLAGMEWSTGDPATGIKDYVDSSAIPPSGTAAGDDVLSGETFFADGSWTAQVGTMPNAGQQIIHPSTGPQAISEGYHNGTGYAEGDADLTAGNIKSGAEIFGVSGNVIEATGDAAAGEVLSGRTFSRTGAAGVTGTMPARTLSAAGETVDAGYYAATTLSAVDADLTAANIKSAVALFGKTGTLTPPTGTAGAADVFNGKTFNTGQWTNTTGSMPNRGAWTSARTDRGTTTIDGGYHDGSGNYTCNYDKEDGYHSSPTWRLTSSGTELCTTTCAAYGGCVLGNTRCICCEQNTLTEGYFGTQNTSNAKCECKVGVYTKTEACLCHR